MRGMLAITLVVTGLATAPAMAQAVGPEDLVNAQNALFGRHKGLRSAHPKGVCASGSFTPTAEAASLSVAPHFATPVSVTARFSMAGGNPKVSDKSRTPRGLAVRFELPGGGESDLVMLSSPVFAAKDPATFHGILTARLPDPATGKPDQAKIQAFLDAHPDAKVQGAYMAKAPISTSYATAPYFGISTFFFTNAKGERRPARWSLVPTAGIVGLTEAELATTGDDYLIDELRQRVAKGPAGFEIWLQMPAAGDPLDDPTVAWPEDRPKTRVGTLAIDKVAAAGSPGACEGLMFDPNNLAKGIEPSADPILAIRSAAYAVSLARRTE